MESGPFTGGAGRPHLLIATHNRGKLREFRALLADCGYEVVGLDDVGVTAESPETGDTFEANAVQKARFYHDATGLPAVADDSGLEVDALGGDPGVQSARYGGPGLDDRGRVDLLLRNLQGVPDARRTGRFVAALAFVAPDGATAIFRGTLEGRIAHAPVGDHGFGYDPVFYLPEHGCTTAQLDPGVKNRVSHRARAAVQLHEYLLQHRPR